MRRGRALLLGYGAFCAVNWAIAYSAARSGSPTIFGSAGLLNLNESLARLNVLRWVIDPLAVAEAQSGAAVGNATLMPAAGPALPNGATVTVQPSGTTTTF